MITERPGASGAIQKYVELGGNVHLFLDDTKRSLFDFVARLSSMLSLASCGENATAISHRRRRQLDSLRRRADDLPDRRGGRGWSGGSCILL